MSTNIINARLYQKVIREALLHEWDPIGVSDLPEVSDEYDSYVPQLYKLLIAKRPKAKIVDYLWWLETVHMALIGDRQATEKFAQRLLLIEEQIRSQEVRRE